MTRLRGILLGGCIAATCVAAGAVPSTASARTCSTPAYPGSGYFTSLSVRKVSCREGKKVTLAHYRCRTAHGPKGRCKRLVRGFRCREQRNSISTEINSRVTCRRGTKRVVYTYQQNI